LAPPLQLARFGPHDVGLPNRSTLPRFRSSPLAPQSRLMQRQQDGEDPQERDHCQKESDHGEQLQVLEADCGFAVVIGWMCVT
jgi:hypothetical protein